MTIAKEAAPHSRASSCMMIGVFATPLVFGFLIFFMMGYR